jgi:DNA-binding transcriptional ArsR family regulator
MSIRRPHFETASVDKFKLRAGLPEVNRTRVLEPLRA